VRKRRLPFLESPKLINLQTRNDGYFTQLGVTIYTDIYLRTRCIDKCRN
jgi:hypothetical protein